MVYKKEEQEIATYKIAVIEAMKNMGASTAQINLVREGAIKYAIINKNNRRI